MENLIYSLNATVPIFAVIFISYLLAQRGFFPESFTRGADKFIFKVLLPVLLFRDISAGKITELFDMRFCLFCMISTTIIFLTIWFFAARFFKDQTMVGAFVQGSFRGSLAVLGIAFMQNMYGDAGVMPLMIVATVPLFNIYSVIVLTVCAKNRPAGGHPVRDCLKSIATNPIILGILAGLPFSLLQITFPSILVKTINSFASMATPLALVTIGAGFEGRKAIQKLRPTLVASFIKLIALPVLFLPIAYMLGFREQALVSLLIMLGAPSTVTCYIMARNMDGDAVLSSSIIVLTTLLSSVTLTAFLWVMRSAGAI